MWSRSLRKFLDRRALVADELRGESGGAEE